MARPANKPASAPVLGRGGSAAGRLVVCPTPIGNLDDVTLRVLQELAGADVVACEDTRRTAKLLARHSIEAKLTSYHEHNERQKTPQLIVRLERGETVALASDAGMPAISDPGFRLIGAAFDAGVAVDVLPGPSAVTTALVASGISAPDWCFVGFLPRRAGELRELVEGARRTLVAFEAPGRVIRSIDEIAAIDPDRPVAVCRELTKLHGEVLRGRAADVVDRLRRYERMRGEITVVVGAPAPRAPGKVDVTLVEAVTQLVEGGAKARRAATVVAELASHGGRRVGANAVYGAWVKTKRNG